MYISLITLFTLFSYTSSKKCISHDELEKNMPAWVDQVPYSHLKNSTWGYPTDCSGFVSWALQTDEYLKAYEYGSTKYSTRIDYDDMKRGDIVTHVFDDGFGRSKCKDSNSGSNSNSVMNMFYNENEDNESDMIIGDDNNNNLKDVPKPPEISGHVYFFDKWVDDSHDEFWAYESTSAADQTDACLEENGPMTWPSCLNHHVKKKRKKVEKWSEEKCESKKYGTVTGGPQRLSTTLLCEK